MKSESQRGPELEPGKKADAFAVGLDAIGSIIRLRDRLEALQDPNVRKPSDVIAKAREKYAGMVRTIDLLLRADIESFFFVREIKLLQKEGIIVGTPDLLTLSDVDSEGRVHLAKCVPISSDMANEIRQMQKLPKNVREVLGRGSGRTGNLLGLSDSFEIADFEGDARIDLVKWTSIKELNAKS